MKILFLTQYYPPEIGAPQNRLSELAVRLQSNGLKVTVLTALPNYPLQQIYKEYEGKNSCVEEIDGIEVHRSWIFVRKSKSILSRLLNYFSFVLSSILYARKNISAHELILCESPPLFLGISAFLLKKRWRAKLIFNVSDLWPDSAEKLGLVTNKYLITMARWLELFLYRNSDMISCQTQGIVSTIKTRVINKPIYWLRNGVNTEFFNPDKAYENYRRKLNVRSDSFVVFYGGIIGYAQGLEVILHAASAMKNKNVEFVLAGDGPLKEYLMQTAMNMNLENVKFITPFTKKEMPSVLASIDVAIVPLKKDELFLGAIPSKIFEALAMKKPIILGVDGEAKNLFIDEGNCGLYFEPENSQHLVACLEKLMSDEKLRMQLGENARKYVSLYFDRNTIAEEFLHFITINTSLMNSEKD